MDENGPLGDTAKSEQNPKIEAFQVVTLEGPPKEPGKIERACATCDAFDAFPDDVIGECCAGLPTIQHVDGIRAGAWPIVHSLRWCRNWGAK